MAALRIIALSFILLLASWAVPPAQFEAQAHDDHGDVKTYHFRLDDRWRRYKLYRPANMPAESKDSPRPLVLVMHGGAGTDKGMIKLTKGRWHDLADKHGFYVAYPNAVKRSWDFGEGIISTGEVDDLAYFNRVLDHIGKRYDIAKNKVFATGISRGGMASYYLGCNMTERIRAIAPIAMNLPTFMVNECETGAPVPMAMMMGNADPQVPFGGGQIVVLGQRRDIVVSADATLDLWKARNGCADKPSSSKVIDNPKDVTAVELSQWNDCTGAPIRFYEIKNGGHTWPSGLQYLKQRVVGHVSYDIDGADEAWDFFSRF